MASASIAIIGLGEVLWDLLPSGKQLGGAPFNFAFHCQQLGHSSVVVSRVGRDPLGDELRAAVRQAGLSDAFVQIDEEHPTGTVTVAVDAHGQPQYTITPNVAYDYLAEDTTWVDLFANARAVCFGTLAQRQLPARLAIQGVLRRTNVHQAIRIFDINLRQDFYDREVIHAGLTLCNWIKLNDAELPVLRDLIGLHGDTDTALLSELRRRYQLQLAALTRGAHGCLVQTDAAEITLPGVPVQVVDTVGAGDAFTAGLVVSVLEGKSLATAADFANRLAAQVAASAGATPVLDRTALATPS